MPMRVLHLALTAETTQVMMPAAQSLQESWMTLPADSTFPPAAESGSPGAESTVELLALAREGDAAALDRLYARYLSPLRRWARGRLPRWARDLRDTNDLVQDTLLQTLRHIGSFDYRRPGALQAYLREALINRVRDECRRVVRRPVPGAIDEDVAFNGPSPLEEAVGAELLGRYDAALARLGPHEREAVVARIEMGSSYAEIAEALGKATSDAARMAVGRALLRLAEEMRREARQPAANG